MQELLHNICMHCMATETTTVSSLVKHFRRNLQQNKLLRSHNNEPSSYPRFNIRAVVQTHSYRLDVSAGTRRRTRSRSVSSVDGNDSPPASRSLTMQMEQLSQRDNNLLNGYRPLYQYIFYNSLMT